MTAKHDPTLTAAGKRLTYLGWLRKYNKASGEVRGMLRRAYIDYEQRYAKDLYKTPSRRGPHKKQSLYDIADRSSLGVYRVRQVFAGYDEASKYGRKLIKKYGSDGKEKAVFTLHRVSTGKDSHVGGWDNTPGWHITLYTMPSDAKRRGLIG